MSLFNIFENLKITGKFWKKIAPYISGYMLVFIFALLGVWIAYGVDKNLMAGFTLFNFFPGWLRFVCLDLVASALMAIPLGIIVGFFISWDNEIHYPAYIHSLIHDFDLKCIECSNTGLGVYEKMLKYKPILDSYLEKGNQYRLEIFATQ